MVNALKTLLFLFLLCMFSISRKTQGIQSCQQNCEKIGKYQCQICYKSCQTNFQMISCKRTDCDFLNTHCKIQNLSESECITQCCNYSGFSLFTQQNFNLCTGINEFQSSSIVTSAYFVIILSFLGSIVLMLFIILIFACCGYFHNSSGTYLISPQQWLSDKQSDFFENQVRLQQSQKQSCIICFQNNINSITACNHFFHFQCLRQWITKCPLCPICKSKDFGPLKIYCQHCWKKYISYELASERKHFKLVSHENSNKLMCGQCQGTMNITQAEKVQEQT